MIISLATLKTERNKTYSSENKKKYIIFTRKHNFLIGGRFWHFGDKEIQYNSYKGFYWGKKSTKGILFQGKN